MSKGLGILVFFFGKFGRTSVRGLEVRSRPMAIAMATDLSNMRAPRTRGLQTRVRRIRTMPFSTPMASLPKGNGYVEVQSKSTRRCLRPRKKTGCFAPGSGERPRSEGRKAETTVRGCFANARDLGTYALALNSKSTPARCEPAIRPAPCSRASWLLGEHEKLPRRGCAPHFIRAGALGQSRRGPGGPIIIS